MYRMVWWCGINLRIQGWGGQSGESNASGKLIPNAVQHEAITGGLVFAHGIEFQFKPSIRAFVYDSVSMFIESDERKLIITDLSRCRTLNNRGGFHWVGGVKELYGRWGGVVKHGTAFHNALYNFIPQSTTESYPSCFTLCNFLVATADHREVIGTLIHQLFLGFIEHAFKSDGLLIHSVVVDFRDKELIVNPLAISGNLFKRANNIASTIVILNVGAIDLSTIILVKTKIDADTGIVDLRISLAHGIGWWLVV